jgi:hypothetical protein
LEVVLVGGSSQHLSVAGALLLCWSLVVAPWVMKVERTWAAAKEQSKSSLTLPSCCQIEHRCWLTLVYKKIL